MYKDYEEEKKKVSSKKIKHNDSFNEKEYLSKIYKDIHFIKNVILIFLCIYIFSYVFALVLDLINLSVNNYFDNEVTKSCCIDNGGIMRNGKCQLDSSYQKDDYETCIKISKKK